MNFSLNAYCETSIDLKGYSPVHVNTKVASFLSKPYGAVLSNIAVKTVQWPAVRNLAIRVWCQSKTAIFWQQWFFK